MHYDSLKAAAVLVAALMASSVGFAAETADVPRTASGRPDMSGTYDVATLTPFERPSSLGETMALTAEEAANLGVMCGVGLNVHSVASSLSGST